MKDYYFFLTKKDWLEVLSEIEREMHLKYYEAKSYSSNEMTIYSSLSEYESLGVNQSGNQQSESFLVMEHSDEMIVRTVEQTDGSLRYIVDQMKNPESIILRPGGIYQEDYFICGHIGTIGTSGKAKKIFHLFEKNIKQKCKTKVGRYHISKDAEESYKERRFITMHIGQPEEYDVKFV